MVEPKVVEGEMLRLQRGDILVLTDPAHLTMEQSRGIKNAFQTIVPEGVEIVILDGGTTASVLSGGRADRVTELLEANTRLQQEARDANRIMISRVIGYLNAFPDVALLPGAFADFIAANFMRKRSGIYIASKTRHAPRWRQLRDEGLPIISTWVDEAGAGETADFADLWRRCLLEASTAEVVIVYREEGDELKGGFIELGAALLAGVPVIGVGLEDLTIGKSGRVQLVPTIEFAIDAAKRLVEVKSQ